jgi:hypothetical protein
LVGGYYTILEELYPGLAQAAIGLMPTINKVYLYLEISEIDNGLGVASYYRSTVSIYERMLLSPLLAFHITYLNMVAWT